ncbi:MAG: SDR family NAD(P)-dependent oxidoreductase, partial [Parahaliea sp.]
HTQVIQVNFTSSAPARQAPATESKATGASEPDVLALDQLAGLGGHIVLRWHAALMQRLFPGLCNSLPWEQIAALLASTEIVGMKCPGLYSIYGGLKLQFDPHTASGPGLDYRVTAADERFKRIAIQVENGGVQGEIETFYRSPPVAQASYRAVAGLVAGDEFTGRRALVIGGSRGLGEVMAKLLAAAGADTLITYARGADDAARVAAEISAGGGACRVRQYDVLRGGTDLADSFDDGPVSDIFYLASPLIEKSDGALWNPDLFGRYCQYYLQGLAQLLSGFAAQARYARSRLGVWSPSTIFLTQPEKGFQEYCAAKAAMESLTQHLAVQYPAWSCTAPRLPRLLTDQTGAVERSNVLDTASIMHGVLRETLPDYA